MELSLSSYPDSGTEDSDIEDEASWRRFSHLLTKRMSTGRPLLARVQKHQQTTMAGSLTTGVEEAEGPHTPRVKEQGKVFQQKVAIMRDTLRKEVVPFHRCSVKNSTAVISTKGPVSEVSIVPAGTGDDCWRTVLYDSGHTNLYIV